MGAHNECLHEKEWGIMEVEISSLKHCAAREKERLDDANDKITNLQIGQVSKQDLKDVQQNITFTMVLRFILFIGSQFAINWGKTHGLW